LDSSITRLLVVTKQLLQGLEQWAQGYLTEENVSDIYVRLGDGFETCVGAFHRVGISTRELDAIPSDLRVCLEQCLAEDPCQESLNLYLPAIRQIIYNLLEGLKRRQALYKRNMANANASSQDPAVAQVQAHPAPPQTIREVSPSKSQQGLSEQEQPAGLPDIPPESQRTLAALRGFDPLERRASKRYSSFAFNKMLPSSPNKRRDGAGAGSGSGSSPQRPAMRRADSLLEKIPPMPPLPEAHRVDPSASARMVKGINGGDGSKTPTPPTPALLQVYLQLGRQVKRCRLETPVTFEGLRLLFMEKFEYDSGLGDFPDVYVRDPVSGVGYELEEIEDVREGSVLSLNIEPLDQVRQHFDQTFAGLMSEVKEMKKALDHSRRMSLSTATSLLAPASRLPSPLLAPSDPSLPSVPIRREKLEEQHESLQSLRRDLAVMRQIHSDFLSETKTAFSALRTQNNSMKEVIKTKIGGSRALLDNSKAKLESQCSETIQAVEEIQDIIDAAREDAYKRFVTPSSSHMKKIRTELDRALGLADRFASDVGTSEGTWRATWAQELSRVKEEQNLLAHQRKLGDDLKNDLKDAAEMWDNVEAFVLQRKGDMSPSGTGSKTPTRIIGYRPPTPDADLPGGGVNNLLMEIRTKEADPNTRLRAIEAQQRQREKEKMEKLNEKDEFAGELEGFVNGRKLRKTGGTEEVERARSRRQELTLKKMLTGDQPPLSSQHTGGGRMGSSASVSTSGSAVNSPAPAGVKSPGTPSMGGKALTPQMTGGSITGGARIMTPQMTGSSVRSGVSSGGGTKRGSVEMVKEEEG
ncbi:actin interacting protein 3-domain-containing protein, partial [Dioszegia hungarica]